MLSLRQVLANESRDAIEVYCRAQSRTAYCGEGVAICRVLGDVLMYVSTKDTSIAPHLMLDGFWEMWTTIAIGRYIKQGMRCIDIGANWGYFTLLMRRLGAECWSFEPNPSAYQLLKRNLRKNGMSPLHLNNAAVSDQEQQMALVADPEDQGGAWVSPCSTSTFGATIIRANTLDEIAEEMAFDLIKIDAEGHEAAIWRGMQQVIARSPQLRIVMEVNQGDPDVDAMLVDMRAKGFKLCSISPSGDPVKRADLAFIADEPGQSAMLWLER